MASVFLTWSLFSFSSWAHGNEYNKCASDFCFVLQYVKNQGLMVITGYFILNLKPWTSEIMELDVTFEYLAFATFCSYGKSKSSSRRCQRYFLWQNEASSIFQFHRYQGWKLRTEMQVLNCPGQWISLETETSPGPVQRTFSCNSVQYWSTGNCAEMIKSVQK